MIGFRYIVLSFLAVSLRHVHTLSDQEKQNLLAFMLPSITECSKIETLSNEFIEGILKTGDLKAINPCFVSCVAKNIGMFNDKGQLDEGKAMEIAEKFLSEEDLKPVPEILKKCLPINDAALDDGQKCERVTLLLNCATPLTKFLFPTN